MAFTFSTAGSIVFGRGTAAQLPKLVAERGQRVFVVLGGHVDADQPFLAGLGSATQLWRASGEPTVAGVAAAVDAARDFAPDVIVGVGGGSVIDTAKAVGILLGNGGGPLDYLEIVGAGAPLTEPSRPVIAVPTTAGTGAEVTANAPLLSLEHGIKASLRAPAMLPVVALVDPDLTLTCPPAVTAAAGMDALTQCLEPLTSIKANALTDILASEGLRRAARGLRAAYADGTDVVAREDMSLCSLLGGLSLANAKLGAVHGLAAGLAGLVPTAAHGEICAAVLAQATATNLAVMRDRQPDNPALAAYERAAQILTGHGAATADDGVDWLRQTARQLGVRGLGELGLRRDQFTQAAAQALAASSMQGNPVALTPEDVIGILETAF